MPVLRNVQCCLLREVDGMLRVPLPADLGENAPGAFLLYALDEAGDFVFVGRTAQEETPINADPTPREKVNVFCFRFANELTAHMIGTTITVDGINAPVAGAGGEAIAHVRRCGHFHAAVSV